MIEQLAGSGAWSGAARRSVALSRPVVLALVRTPVGSSTHRSPVNSKGPARGPFVFTGGEGGIDSLAPRAHPSGGLRPSVARLCRARFEPRWVRPHTLSRQKKAPRRGLFLSGGEGGIDSLPLEAHPSGGLRPSVARLCRARIEPVDSSTHALETKKGPARGPFVVIDR